MWEIVPKTQQRPTFFVSQQTMAGDGATVAAESSRCHTGATIYTVTAELSSVTRAANVGKRADVSCGVRICWLLAMLLGNELRPRLVSLHIRAGVSDEARTKFQNEVGNIGHIIV